VSEQRVGRDNEDRMRDLRTIESFRSHSKRDGIMNMLNVAITTQHTLFASLGSTEFFEFVLRNPFNVDHMVFIECHDPNLTYDDVCCFVIVACRV